MVTKANEAIFTPIEEGRFRFACHKGIACFTECCAKLKLVLTPYDILRLKNRLSIPSYEFLDTFTETLIENNNRFPMVKLKMNHQGGGKCPFVTPEGCTVYEDRPIACRLYPVGNASAFIGLETPAKQKFFLVQESHCLGFEEDKEWTLDEWLSHEGVKEYNAINEPWMRIVTSPRTLGEGDSTRKFQMFFMASYNLDRFREFIFNTKFFQVFDISIERKDLLATDDTELLKLAFDWLRFSLFGEMTLQPIKRE